MGEFKLENPDRKKLFSFESVEKFGGFTRKEIEKLPFSGYKDLISKIFMGQYYKGEAREKYEKALFYLRTLPEEKKKELMSEAPEPLKERDGQHEDPLEVVEKIKESIEKEKIQE